MLLLDSGSVPLDISITISAIVAFCAIVSPILTAIINNRHHTHMLKIEMDRKHYEETILHRRDVLENYLRCAGNCSTFADNSALAEYGRAYCIALMYAPTDLRDKMVAIHQLMVGRNYEAAANALAVLAPMMYGAPQTP